MSHPYYLGIMVDDKMVIPLNLEDILKWFQFHFRESEAKTLYQPQNTISAWSRLVVYTVPITQCDGKSVPSKICAFFLVYACPQWLFLVRNLCPLSGTHLLIQCCVAIDT